MTNLLLNQEEKKLLDDISRTAAENYWVEDEIISMIESDQLQAARDILISQQLKSVNGMFNAVQNMIQYQQSEFKKEITSNNTHHEISNRWLLILFSIGLVLSIIIASGVLWRFRRMDKKQNEIMQDLIANRDQAIRSQIEAEKANKIKTEFLSSMSHELRTPLNAVIGFSHLLSEDENLTEDQQENIELIANAGDHLLTVINSILDLSRIETGNTELDIKSVSLKKVIEQCSSIVISMAEAKGITLRMPELKDDILLHADETKLKQVLLNLITNAIKYNRESGQVSVGYDNINENQIKLWIKDTGSGIPLDKQPRLFTSFDRLGREAGTIEGSGIGLVISKKLMELMGGEIGFESTPGKGSTFWVKVICSGKH